MLQRVQVLFLLMVVMLGVSPAFLSVVWAADVSALKQAKPATEEVGHGDISPYDMAPWGEEGYLIGPGDVLNISIWKDEALTCACVVRPDGAISFPLIGDVRAAGKTASELKVEIGVKLDRYIPEPTLSVEVKQVNSLIIYVVGEVNAPGRYVLNSNVEVLQAIAIGGGLNVFAKRNKIKVFRHGENETIIFPFEYDKVIEGKRLEQNIRLKRGDVLVIP